MNENEQKLFEERLKTAFRDVDVPPSLLPESVVARLGENKRSSVKPNIKRFASIAAALVIFVGGAAVLTFYMSASGKSDATPLADAGATEEVLMFDSASVSGAEVENGLTAEPAQGVVEDKVGTEDNEKQDEAQKEDEKDKDDEDDEDEEKNESNGEDSAG